MMDYTVCLTSRNVDARNCPGTVLLEAETPNPFMLNGGTLPRVTYILLVWALAFYERSTFKT